MNSMNYVHIYAIGGRWNPGPSGDEYVGCAYDAITALSLLDLVESKGGYAVSLHGTILHWFAANSGECSVLQARNTFVMWRDKESMPAL